jgi:hypothetical protein
VRLFNPVDLLTGGFGESPRKPQLSGRRTGNPQLSGRTENPELSGGQSSDQLPPGRFPPGSELPFNGFAQRPRKPPAPVRATHATERARRLVRKIAVATFGRGKTTLDYRYGHWFVHVYGPDGRAVASFVAVDRSPGAFGTGVDLVPAP